MGNVGIASRGRRHPRSGGVQRRAVGGGSSSVSGMAGSVRVFIACSTGRLHRRPRRRSLVVTGARSGRGRRLRRVHGRNRGDSHGTLDLRRGDPIRQVAIRRDACLRRHLTLARSGGSDRQGNRRVTVGAARCGPGLHGRRCLPRWRCVDSSVPRREPGRRTRPSRSWERSSAPAFRCSPEQRGLTACDSRLRSRIRAGSCNCATSPRSSRAEGHPTTALEATHRHLPATGDAILGRPSQLSRRR